MTFNAYFDRTRACLTDFLEVFLARKGRELAVLKPWGPDIAKRLAAFTLKGKMIRGGLVALGYELAGKRLAPDAVRAGAAMELAQSALLIHDDIMDRDARRRGEPSLHQQYIRLGEAEGVADPVRFGEGMGICAGEIALFLAFEALAGLAAPKNRAAAALGLFAREFTLVGLGQMQDLSTGHSYRPATEKEVLALYRLKTARYSFSLPLVLGCLLAGGDRKLRSGLERCGEDLGLIFQLRDDELGLFGEAGELGKPIGSDVRQGKKTLIYLLLLDRASEAEKRTLATVIGNPVATDADIAFVQELALKHGVREEVGRRVEGLSRRAARRIRGLSVRRELRDVLEGLLEYTLTRRK